MGPPWNKTSLQPHPQGPPAAPSPLLQDVPASYQVDLSSSNCQCGLKVCFPNHSGNSPSGARSEVYPDSEGAPSLFSPAGRGWRGPHSHLSQGCSRVSIPTTWGPQRGSFPRREAPQTSRRRREAQPPWGRGGCGPVQSAERRGALPSAAPLNASRHSPSLRGGPTAPRAGLQRWLSARPLPCRSRSSRSPATLSPKASETATPKTGECPEETASATGRLHRAPPDPPPASLPQAP